ncbi:MAG: 4-(cytidine 5'-diphospho)-2-C-methyl-D-erythritol kinase, partial [Cytophagaceae bacterium]
MISFPNAKINLGLYITEKRKDGFHSIETCFYPIPLCDALEILPSKSTLFTSSGIDIPGSAKGNLCLQAYELLKKDFDLPSVHIHLHKNIPIGAGLGGGSSDGAYTIKTLNKLFKLNLREDRMAEYAGKLGSDCPFFIYNNPLIARGKGDEFSSTSIQLSGKYMILVYPDVHISTAEAYAGVKPEYPG